MRESAFLIGRRPPGRAPWGAIRLRDGLVVVLALTTGSVDAVSYLRLGKVFSSVITGNLALLGISAGQRNTGLAVNAGLALAGYGLGVLAGGALAGTPEKDQPVWPGRATVTLALELLMLAGFSGGWLSAGGHPSGGPRLVLLAVAAAAMGMQSVAVRRLGPMSTTHLTPLILATGWLHDGEHLAYLVAGYLFFLPVVGSEPARWRPPLSGRYLLLLAAMPADIVTGAALMLARPFGGYGAADVHAAGVIMLAGSELIMTALAILLAVNLVRSPTPLRQAVGGLEAYNARLALLASGSSRRARDPGNLCRGAMINGLYRNAMVRRRASPRFPRRKRRSGSGRIDERRHRES
jgi:uncharacterized membrane protein YoaK (UPF0700 family)